MEISRPRTGQRVRFALWHDDEWRPLLWLRVGSDGSVYLGTLFGRPSQGLRVSKQAAGKKPVSFKDAEGVPFTGIDLLKSSRISFKASGEIHFGGDVLDGPSLTGLSDRRQLCLARFPHPTGSPAASTRNANDYDVGIADYPIESDFPLYASVYVSPWAGVPPKPVAPPRMTVWSNMWFAFEKLKRTQDLVIQVAIGHGIRGVWPKVPGVVVAGNSR
jgi:hypothetical protein